MTGPGLHNNPEQNPGSNLPARTGRHADPTVECPTQPACVEFYETPQRVEARLAVSASKAPAPKA
ncbi:hypothetical protein, partial [Nocardia testacea]